MSFGVAIAEVPFAVVTQRPFAGVDNQMHHNPRKFPRSANWFIPLAELAGTRSPSNIDETLPFGALLGRGVPRTVDSAIQLRPELRREAVGGVDRGEPDAESEECCDVVGHPDCEHVLMLPVTAEFRWQVILWCGARRAERTW